MSNPLSVTSGKEWRKANKEGFVIELPSGNVVKMRPVAIDALVMAGKIPDVLSSVAAESLWIQTDEDKLRGQTETIKRYTELVNLIVPLALLEPRVVDNPTSDDEIALDDIEFMDKTFIFQITLQPAGVLRRFRLQQAGDVDAVHDGQDDSAAA